MSSPISRRTLLTGAAVLALAGCSPTEISNSPSPPKPTAAPEREPIPLDLSDLPPAAYGVWGQLGDVTVEHEPDLRMRMCSTMKLPLVGLVLERTGGIDGDPGMLIDLAEPLQWSDQDLIGHSPFTRAQPNRTATVGELSEAAARESDNTAANLLIARVGGLGELTRFARKLGDETTRFDRLETAMNVADGDLDTTTAIAFGKLATAIFDTLDADALTSLLAWLPDGSDGRRISAAAPTSLPMRHKTGTSGDGAFNDVAILLPEAGKTGSLAIFTDTPGSESDEVVVEIARRAFQALGAA